MKLLYVALAGLNISLSLLNFGFAVFLHSALWPISIGAGIFSGSVGVWMMSLAREK